jgi:hypothetical protein
MNYARVEDSKSTRCPLLAESDRIPDFPRLALVAWMQTHGASLRPMRGAKAFRFTKCVFDQKRALA